MAMVTPTMTSGGGKETSEVPSGFDYQYVDSPPERLVCVLCGFPCRDPFLSVCCGHNFCRSCVDGCKEVAAAISVMSTCPVCRDEDFVTFPNKQADREIKSLHMMCTNKGRGCEWQGELNDINNHLGNSDGCQFEDVKCSNECGKILQRQYLISHLETECPYRKVDCQYCHTTGEHQFIEREHKQQCPKLPLPCPNKCEVGSVAREDMEAHRKECPLEMVQCDYHSVGCTVKVNRVTKRKHDEEKVGEHLLMIKLAKTEDRLVSTEAKLSLTETRLGSLEVMLHRLVNTTRSSDNLIGSTQWSFHLSTISTRVKVVPQICPVIVKMSDFGEYKELQVCWYSEPFYSHNEGYKLCLRVDPDGHSNGKGTHLSVFLYLMKGPHDDELKWPLRGKFEMKLLNQTSDCEHHSEIVHFNESVRFDVAGKIANGERASRGRGHQQFILNEDLNKVTLTRQYLKDDCLFFKINQLLV
ncbi:TNF receptor-associated factor 4-like [Dysidea avara]|uniref:TNF receptor-associated factor 4-like n=1 Tax=Dysidea avara TaxID=196820 RepID=UPI003316B5A4